MNSASGGFRREDQTQKLAIPLVYQVSKGRTRALTVGSACVAHFGSFWCRAVGADHLLTHTFWNGGLHQFVEPIISGLPYP